jgi:UDP-N-acetyl-D-galactosamine dehydrogenase
VLAVAHEQFLKIGLEDLQKKIVRRGCLIDVQAVLDAEALRREGIRVWRL